MLSWPTRVRFSVAADVRSQRESRYSPGGRYRNIIVGVRNATVL